MKVTVINGTDKKGCTYKIKESFLKSLGEGHNVTEWYLPKDSPHFCKGCFACFDNGLNACVHKDSIVPIWESITEADLIVVSAPVYVFHTTGAMKALLDHLFIKWMVHKPEPQMFFKRAVILTNSLGAGLKSAENGVKDSLSYWGISELYCMRFKLLDTDWERVASDKIDTRLKRLAEKLNLKYSKNKPVKVSLKKKFIFKMMGFAHKMINKKRDPKTSDYFYWKENGWFDGKRPWNAKKKA